MKTNQKKDYTKKRRITPLHFVQQLMKTNQAKQLSTITLPHWCVLAPLEDVQLFVQARYKVAWWVLQLERC